MLIRNMSHSSIENKELKELMKTINESKKENKQLSKEISELKEKQKKLLRAQLYGY